MVVKRPICPERIRRVPRQFSWLDQRLVRDRHIDRCSHAAATLYLFLVTVGDAQGLSYCGDASIMNHLGMDAALLQQARDQLVRIGLIAWQAPLYQVLALEQAVRTTLKSKMRYPVSLGDILKQAAGGAHD
jgi:hypothetical protein